MSGYTPEQTKRWCVCQAWPVNPDCPVHGDHVVEWAVFTREVSLLDEEFQPIGGEYTTEEYPGSEALDMAENELESIKRHDSQSGVDYEYQLRYRLIGEWIV